MIAYLTPQAANEAVAVGPDTRGVTTRDEDFAAVATADKALRVQCDLDISVLGDSQTSSVTSPGPPP
jgi:hypothetical protein